MSSRLILASSLLATLALAEKPTISYKAPPSGDDDRPVMTSIVVSAQGTDYAFKLEFNKPPWGEDCKTRCANATLFLDTDNNKTTGLKLADPKAAETGTDIAVTIQGAKALKEGVSTSVLRVKVMQYSEDATSVEEGRTLIELDPINDSERVLASDTSVYLLIDANMGDQPAGKQLRIVYHPPESKPLVGTAKGLASPSSSRVELFKDGKLTNPPPKKKKSDYEKL
ncbi:MAG: hypothetical protein Q8L48_07225 [Archangium sp.]|nr:hypothetical protein [Archangium sp.]